MNITAKQEDLNRVFALVGPMIPAKAKGQYSAIADKFMMMADENNGVTVHALAGELYTVFSVPATISAYGSCVVDKRLITMVKAARGDEVTLRYNKKLSVTTSEGFRSTVAVLPDMTYPFESLLSIMDGELLATVVIDKQDLMDMMRLRMTLSTATEGVFMGMNVSPDGVYCYTPPTEYGEIESFPIRNSGCSYRADMLLAVEYFRAIIRAVKSDTVQVDFLNAPKEENVTLIITDPEDDSWYAYTKGTLVNDYKAGQ